MTNIKDKRVLGVLVSRIHVTEFPKQDLLRCPMRIMSRDQNKPRAREPIGSLVTAGISGKNKPLLSHISDDSRT